MPDPSFAPGGGLLGGIMSLLSGNGWQPDTIAGSMDPSVWQRHMMMSAYPQILQQTRGNVPQAMALMQHPELAFPHAVGNVEVAGMKAPVMQQMSNLSLGLPGGAPGGNSLSDLFNAGLKMQAAQKQQETEIPEYEKQYQAMQMAGNSAEQNVLPLINQAKTLLADPRFVSGTAHEQRLAWKQFVATSGIGDPNAAAPTEALQSVLKQLVLSQIRPMLQGTGRVMQTEVNSIIGAVGDIPNTVPGIAAKLGIMENGANRVIGLRDLAQDYKTANGRLDVGYDRQSSAFLKRQGALPSVAIAPAQQQQVQQPLQQPQQAGPRQVASKADYDALPSGTPYQAPDGSIRVKR